MLYFRSFLKFVLLFVVIFIVIFTSIIAFNILPLTPVKNSLLAVADRDLLFYSFCFSVVNSLIISLFFYSVVITDKKSKLFLIKPVLPVVFTTAVLFMVNYYLKPDLKIDKSIMAHDARLFLPERSFIDFKHEIPLKLNEKDFNDIVKRLSSKDMEIIKYSYVKSNKDGIYYLDNVALRSRADILKIFSSTGFYKNVKIFIGKVNRFDLNDLLIYEDARIDHYDNVKVDFNEGGVTIHPEAGRDYVFKKIGFLNINTSDASYLKGIIRHNFVIMGIFFAHDNNLYKLIFWISMCYFLFTMFGFIFIADYKVISVCADTIVLVLFFIYFDAFYSFINVLINYVVPSKYYVFRTLFVSGIIFFVSLLVNVVKFLFMKVESDKNI